MRIEYFRRARPIFIFFGISRRRWLFTQSVFASFISRNSFLFSYWVEVSSKVLPFNKRMLHCHNWSPSWILINSENTFEEINESIHRVHFTIRNYRLESIWINNLSLSLSLFKLHKSFLVDKSLFEIIKRTQLNILFRNF